MAERARIPVRCEAAQVADGQRGNRSQERKQQAFRKELAKDARAFRPNRKANVDLMLTPHAASHEQAAQVGARNSRISSTSMPANRRIG